MWRAQHIGHHVTAWQNGGTAEMPIAVAIGWEPSLGLLRAARRCPRACANTT